MTHRVHPLTSMRMRRIKSKKTKLELRFAALLRKEGIKHRSHPNLYGHPDFRIIGTKVIVFCDSAFWHGRRREEITGRAFRVNKSFWVKKLLYNKTRDKRITTKLKRMGWTVMRFWDDDIYRQPEKIISKIKRHVA